MKKTLIAVMFALFLAIPAAPTSAGKSLNLTEVNLSVGDMFLVTCHKDSTLEFGWNGDHQLRGWCRAR